MNLSRLLSRNGAVVYRAQKRGSTPFPQYLSTRMATQHRSMSTTTTATASPAPRGRWPFGRVLKYGIPLSLLAGGYYMLENDAGGLERSLYFYLRALPPYIHYRIVQFQIRDEDDSTQTKEFARLHHMYRERPLEVILMLRGFYTKIGQIISGLDGGIFPSEYVESLKVLQSDVPPQPLERMLELLEAELGCKVEDVFSSFEPKPLGAASIGQVHRATLIDGTPVVVKIQYPETEKNFRLDIATLRSFCELAQPEQVPLFDEIEKQFMSEFDYVVEAQQLRQAALNAKELFPQIKIPTPVDENHPHSPRPEGLCTRKVLVMEELKGVSLQRSQRDYLAKMAHDQDKTISELEDEMRAEIMNTPLDQVKVPSEFAINTYRKLLTAQDYVRNSTALVYNWTLGWVGAPIRYEWQPAPVNSYRLLDLVFKVHGHQLFFDGYFNGDPHPGNILLLEDGRLGLIDYGQVKQMAVSDRVKLAKLIVALDDDDEELIVQRWKECGYSTQHDNARVILASARFSFDRWTPDVVDEFGGLPLFQEELAKIDKCTHMPNEYIMAHRLSALLRLNAMGLGHVNGKYARTAQFWRPQAEAFLISQGEKW